MKKGIPLPDPAFDTMSLDERKGLKRELDKAIANYDDRRKAEAKRDLKENARQYGFSLFELTETKTTKRTAVTSKYRKPSNLDQVWSGRGRQPGWFREAIVAGTDPDTLKIQGSPRHQPQDAARGPA